MCIFALIGVGIFCGIVGFGIGAIYMDWESSEDDDLWGA